MVEKSNNNAEDLKDLDQAKANQEVDIIIKDEDLEKTKIYLKKKKSGWMAVTATSLHMPEGHRSVVADWHEQAKCHNMNHMFFPEKNQRFLYKHILQPMCQQCPVRVDCMEAALFNREKFGLWGGLTIPSLDRIQKARLGFIKNLPEERKNILIRNLGLSEKTTRALEYHGLQKVKNVIFKTDRHLKNFKALTIKFYMNGRIE